MGVGLTARSSGGEGLEIEPISDQDLDAEFMSLRPRLVRFAASLTRSKSDAEDVVQEVWLRWRRHRHTVASPPAWLRAVTRRVVLDMRATPAGSTAVDVETLAAPSDLAPPRVEAETDILPALEVVLALLSPLERAVFVLRQGLEWSNADIARLLGRAGPAIRQLHRRARAHMAVGATRYDVSPDTLSAVAAAYASVSDGADIVVLLDVLAPGLAFPRPRFRHRGREVLHDTAGVVLAQGDRLLLCHRRVELRWYPGVWDVAGAHLRHGEPPAACAVRAARDELGITIFGPEQLLEHTEDDFRLTLFLVTSWEGEIRNASTAQHDQVRLLTREQATSLKLADKRYLSLFDHIAA